MPENQTKTDPEKWERAVSYLRSHYGDSYGDRVELGAALSRFAHSNGLPASKWLGSEAVLQPLIRYQDIPPADARDMINRKAPEAAEDIEKILTAFAEADGAGAS